MMLDQNVVAVSPATVYRVLAKAGLKYRLALVQSNSRLEVLEQPEHKRRWNVGDLGQKALAEVRELALDSIESIISRSLEPRSVRFICHELERDPSFRGFVAFLRGDDGVQLEAAVQELIEPEAVPEFDACYLSDAGLERLRTWRVLWEEQRREDAGEARPTNIPDVFAKPDYVGHAWKHRDEYNVRTERFISYPGCESSVDPTPVYGWAGWNHLQRAHAVLSLYERRRTDEQWPKERLVPLLAALQELVPWLVQWHNEPTEDGERPGETYASELERHLGLLSLSPADLRAWRAPKGRDRRSTARAAKARVLVKSIAETATDDTQASASGAVPPSEPPTPPSRRPRQPRQKLDPERVLASVAEQGGTATLKELVGKLDQSERAVRAAADALVTEGRLVKARQRPITYATVAAEKAST
jgi:hypothetical protein